MSQDYRELGKGQDPKWQKGVNLVTEFAKSLEKQGLLPKRFEQPAIAQETPDGVIAFSSEQLKGLEKRGKFVMVEMNAETLKMLEERTGVHPYVYGAKAEKAAKLPTMRAQVAVFLDGIQQETFGKPFDAQVSILKNAHTPIDGVTDTWPQTPADAAVIGQKVFEQTEINILSGLYTRTGDDGSVLVGGLGPGVRVRVSGDFRPDWASGDVGLLSLAVPTAVVEH